MHAYRNYPVNGAFKMRLFCYQTEPEHGLIGSGGTKRVIPFHTDALVPSFSLVGRDAKAADFFVKSTAFGIWRARDDETGHWVEVISVG